MVGNTLYDPHIVTEKETKMNKLTLGAIGFGAWFFTRGSRAKRRPYVDALFPFALLGFLALLVYSYATK